MNANFIVECKTCHRRLRIRVQAGYYNWIPFTYSCPKCKVVCKGEIYIPSQISPKEKRNEQAIDNLKNCIYINDDTVGKLPIEEVIQLSTELYTDKIMKHEGALHQIYHFTPHMQYSMMGKDTTLLQQKVLDILKDIYTRQENYSAFWDLYENSSPFLYRKKKALNLVKKISKYRNEKEKIGFLQDYLYEQLRDTDYYKLLKEELFIKLREIRKKKYIEFKKLSQIINNRFFQYSKKVYTVTANFLNYYNYILPVILNEITYSFDIDEIKEKWGIAQTDFEFLKSSYSENYEDLKDFIYLLILINNAYYRKGINDFHACFKVQFPEVEQGIREDVSIFNKKVKNVGNRIKILNYDSVPANINKVFDNLIRNSIDHRDYVYNYNIQLISFNNKSDERKMYLIEFSNNLFQGFLLANILWDILMFFAEEENILLSE